MNLLDAIVNAQDGTAVQQVGSQVGLAPDQVTTALSAAAQTGLSAEVLKRLLPLAATLMVGAFSKHRGEGSIATAPPGASGGGIAAMLTPFLDRNRDGSIVAM